MVKISILKKIGSKINDRLLEPENLVLGVISQHKKVTSQHHGIKTRGRLCYNGKIIVAKEVVMCV